MTRLTPAFAVAALVMAVSSVTRLVLAARPDAVVSGGVTVWGLIVAYGLLYDVVTAAYVAAPFALWLVLAPDRVARTRAHRALVVVVFAALALVLIVIAATEWFFWQEFGSRFNFIAVDYLLYTHEVLGNIWQSYPVGWILLALGLLAAALTGPFAGSLWRASGAPLRWPAGLAVLAAWAALGAGTLYGLDSDLKDFSRQDEVNELAGNGLYQFFAANYRNELIYERHYATVPLPEALATVQAALRADGGPSLALAGGDSLERRVVASGPDRYLNVVLVSVESLGADFLGAQGDPRGLTPNLDRLARESLWFSNAYATGNRTVRGLEALSLALPPTPGQSIVRRPNNENLFSLGGVFEDKGYTSLFAYGGYGYFDNVNAFFDANDYRTIDRRSIPASRIEFENIWGVADEHLYDHVIEEIDREKAARPRRPVFMHVMTTSNHRPYTYPAGRIDIPSGSGRAGGVKYSDYAIGRLLETAGRRPWFDDTVFVITADHGANARGTTQIPVDKYRIPVLVYSPKHVPPRRIDRLMSQIDIAPTLLGLLEFSYYSKFFGRDLLHSPPAGDRAFVANYQTLGYLRGDRMVVLQPKRKAEVHRLAGGRPVALVESDPALVREAISFYEAASYVFRNGLYGDEEQTPPEQRDLLARRRRGPS